MSDLRSLHQNDYFVTDLNVGGAAVGLLQTYLRFFLLTD